MFVIPVGLRDDLAAYDCAKSLIGFTLKRDEFRLNRHRALDSCLSMISAQTRSAFVAGENRFTLFRIMP